MESSVFHDQITRSNSSGIARILSGEFTVYCDVIPDDAPQDWSMGPTQKPGEFGLYHEHLHYPRRHGAYAFATGKTPEEAKGKASGFFRYVKDAPPALWTLVEL